MSILYIGSSGALSLVPFKRLLSAGHTVSAIGVYKPIVFNEKVIAIENESLALAANQHNIPLLDLSQPLPKLHERCGQYSIDIILMSCYSKRLPEDIINIADKGCFNMHPSLLPQFRGTEPIFWQMKAASTLGVSWHRVVQEFDAGDVVMQKKVLSDDGTSYLDINMQLAETGAELMIEMLKDLSFGELKAKVQNHEAASYYPYPQQQNFAIDTQWTAQHAYNFMCSTQIFGYTYRCQVAGYCYVLKEALDFDNNASLESVEIQSDRLYIPCSGGVLIARYIDRIPV